MALSPTATGRRMDPKPKLGVSCRRNFPGAPLAPLSSQAPPEGMTFTHFEVAGTPTYKTGMSSYRKSKCITHHAISVEQEL